MESPSSHATTLNRGLKNRHIQLIALGGAVGTGLFLGVSHTIQLAGPSILLGYALGGMIAFFIMRQLGEMVVEEPVAGTFSHFAYRYWSGFAGFMSGWNYWALYVLVGMAELTAIGVYMQYWWPALPTWTSAALFFMLVNAINLAHVRLYGELEFWFSLVKVGAILGMIGFGAWLLASGTGGPQASMANLWQHGGFFPNGVSGLVMAMAIIMFSFGGLELIGITAAEADQPEKSIPRATNQVIVRILVFYVGALLVLLALYPWQKVVTGGSPFVLIFHELNSNAVATALNVVILTAALSVYNSCVYSNSRMLYGLARQGNAPRSLLWVNTRGVPLRALGLSSLATGTCVLLNYLMPEGALGLLMALVVSALVLNWFIISLTHLRFRAAKRKEGTTTRFPSWGYPLTNYLCLVFLAGILVIMLFTPGVRVSVLLIPPWILLLALAYRYKTRKAAANVPASP
ncbi:amino acid permease [Orrella dioscoreae]|uniref:Aromatic amino acid transport protein AroP n=1 Tax=Orrella dioscoreae TaxID=1851544 RepID=A0A1C3K7E5_9BURK|nr:amino acid permease [Orrella dioscoreae]SBT27277.1 Aromatic amino acid transport protein AroP [Orrella dioscoreae]SOE50182.1 Aromatic amino acid transport protein AroP [Orrella dioscoreae]